MESKTPTLWSGFNLLPLGINSTKQYNAIDSGVIMILRGNTEAFTTWSEDTIITEFAVALQKTFDISGDLFV